MNPSQKICSSLEDRVIEVRIEQRAADHAPHDFGAAGAPSEEMCHDLHGLFLRSNTSGESSQSFGARMNPRPHSRISLCWKALQKGLRCMRSNVGASLRRSDRILGTQEKRLILPEDGMKWRMGVPLL
jgi:hypothetical protein